MKGSRVAKRYARALFDLADKGDEEKWGMELERLVAMVESAELIGRLSSPEISEQARQIAMTKIAERLELSFPLRSLAAVVARHGRIRDLGAIAESYRDLVDQAMGRVRATLTFAIEPTDEELAAVIGGLKGVAKIKIMLPVKVDVPLPGTATTATQPSADEPARLEEITRRTARPAKMEIIPIVKIDPALIGGVTAEMGGKIYDGSLTTRLAEAKQRLAG
jgi:F-type H+-transporting ATPase subunit delta